MAVQLKCALIAEYLLDFCFVFCFVFSFVLSINHAGGIFVFNRISVKEHSSVPNKLRYICTSAMTLKRKTRDCNFNMSVLYVLS